MSERLFLGAILLLSAVYLVIAWTSISAPIQYDPLGPETWPILLSIVMLAACGLRLARPVGARLQVTRATLTRLAAMLVLLILYATLFEALGFVLTTWAFVAASVLLLGGKPVRALIAGLVTGVAGYLLFTRLLDLNLPGGVLGFLD